MIERPRRRPSSEGRSGILSVVLNPQLLSLSIGHGTVDAYANLLPMMYPMLTVALGLNYSQVGLAVALYTLSASLSQPLFGYVADRFGGRHMAAAGIVWMATMVSLVGFTWDYWSLVAVLTVAGLGTAAFHPQGAMNAGDVGGHKASAMSVFMLGGNIGFALGPMLGALVFSTALGLRGALLLWLPGVLMALWLYKAIGRVDVKRQAIKAQALAGAALPAARVPIVGVAALVLVVMLRSWASSALINFIPLLFHERGLSLAWASQVLFLTLVAAAAGGVIGGFIADAWGRKRVTFISLAASGPAIFLFLQSAEAWMALGALVVGFLLGASTAVTLVMGQEVLPRNVGMASGLIMGLGFATGGVGVSITGTLADNFGLFTALNSIWPLPLLGALLCLALRKPERSPGGVAVDGG
ncbi:MAG: MFS transporter [Chloroflexota bacterium]